LEDEDNLLAAIESLEGQLTRTLQGNDADLGKNWPPRSPPHWN